MPAETGDAETGNRAVALRTRLLIVLLGPLLLVAIMVGLAGSALVDDVVRRANDRVLGGALDAVVETVRVERAEVTLDLPTAAFSMLENSERDSIFYRVAVGERTLSGYADLPAPAIGELVADQPRFRFARYRDRDIRIAEELRRLPRVEAPVVVQIAETLDYRRAVRRGLILALVAGELALLGVAVLLIRPALSWSLRPLARLRRAVTVRDTRAAPDLSALETGPLPSELEPLAGAFNNLLARLDSATAGVRRFTADASHQMRTPLSVLKVQVALARRGDPRALDEIADAAGRLEHLTTQLLALARADEAGVTPELQQVDLRELAVAVISRRIGQAIDAGIELNLDAPADRIPVPGHRPLMFEILSNLIDNAIRYNRPNGMVTVSIDQNDGRRSIAVADEGPGLSQADIARLGERFVRLSSGAHKEGSGLGFAIVRSAAQRIGAHVQVENTSPGLRVTIMFASEAEADRFAR